MTPWLHDSRTSRLICGLLRPPLHEAVMIFNPGQHATGGYFLFGLHAPGLTTIFANPGQHISSNRLEQSVFWGLISLIRLSLVILIVLCNILYLYLVNSFLISSQGLESEPCREILCTNMLTHPHWYNIRGFGGQVVSALAFHLWGRRFKSQWELSQCGSNPVLSRQKGPTVIGICCCGDPALVGKAK
jgi:hypothetical protein